MFGVFSCCWGFGVTVLRLHLPLIWIGSDCDWLVSLAFRFLGCTCVLRGCMHGFGCFAGFWVLWVSAGVVVWVLWLVALIWAGWLVFRLVALCWLPCIDALGVDLVGLVVVLFGSVGLVYWWPCGWLVLGFGGWFSWLFSVRVGLV